MSYSISPTSKGLFVVVRPHPRMFLRFFIPLWMAVMCLNLTSHPERPIPISGWLVIGPVSIFFSYIWLWNLWGREVLEFTPSELLYRRVLFWPSRNRAFRLEKIVSPRFVQSRSRGMGGYTPSGIGFSYEKHDVRMGEYLTQREARTLVSEISRLSPEWAECWSRYEPGHLEPHDSLSLDLK
jgi:hypothetical protein